MLNNSAQTHVLNACKTYSFDFKNDRLTKASDNFSKSEPESPFTWTEEENNVEYFKSTVRLELKPRMSVSAILEDKEDGGKVSSSS